MKYTLILYVSLFLTIFNSVVKAQSGQTPSSGTAAEQVKALFLKKDRNNPKTQPQPNPAEQGSSSAGGLKPGDIHPDVKYIDADFMAPFYHGVSIVRKGNASGLINKNGEIVIPYNRYKHIGLYNVQSGVMLVSDEFGYAKYMNSFGKIIWDSREIVLSEPCGLYLKLYKSEKKQYIYIDSSGRQITMPYNFRYISENIGVACTSELGYGPYSYITMEGRKLNNHTYDLAEAFNDGMAIVGKYDEFGVLKYGYIDKNGVQVVPYQYTEKPDPFFNGFAVVRAKPYSDIKYAVINKKGQVMFEVKSDDRNRNSPSGFIKRNMCIVSRGVVDTNGVFTSFEAITEKFAEKERDMILLSEPINLSKSLRNPDELIWYHGRFNNMIRANGWINLKTGKSVPPVFLYLENENFFDPVSRLTSVQYLEKTADGKFDKSRTGMVNEEGIFVIMLKEKSKW